MSDTYTNVPSIAAAELPNPVPVSEHDACPVTHLMKLIGDKWTLLVIALLATHPYRYNELHRSIEGISQRMLTRVLRSLGQAGLVDRVVHPTVPPGVEYALTSMGETLLPVLSTLADWAVAHSDTLTPRIPSGSKPSGPTLSISLP